MAQMSLHNACWRVAVPPLLAAVLFMLVPATITRGQSAPQNTPGQQNGAPHAPLNGQAPGAQRGGAGQNGAPGSTTPGKNAPQADLNGLSTASAEEIHIDSATGDFEASGNVHINFSGIELRADQVVGNYNRELIFSGHARMETRGSVMAADAIHFFPRDKSYRLDNPRAALSPDFLNDQVLTPVFINGGELVGARSGYALGEKLTGTTCIEERHHYELRAGSAELFPYQKLVLRHVAVIFFGVKVLYLPEVVIPLDNSLRRFRSDYSPEFGQNVSEGYFARFPYAFAEGAVAATLLVLSVTQKLGEGYQIQQQFLLGKQPTGLGPATGGSALPSFGGTNVGTGSTYVTSYGYGGAFGPGLRRFGTGQGPQDGVLASMSGYFSSGFDRNFSASLLDQQSIGSNNHIAFTYQEQKNSFLSFTDETAMTSHFDFAHTDPGHGDTSDIQFSYTTNDTGGFTTTQASAGYKQSFDFATLGSTRNNFQSDFEFSRYLSDSGTFTSRTEELTSMVQYMHTAREYSVTVDANLNTAVGPQTGGAGSVGALEKVPDITVSSDTINYKGGLLHQLPIHFDFDLGQYNEPSSHFDTERVLMGFTVQESPIVKGQTEIVVGGGFEQRFYGDGAAQYLMHDTIKLREHLGGRSGLEFDYTYQQPEGGTPFFFDTYGKSHYITAEGGYLDDKRFQFTARVGYDFLGASESAPFQSLSTKLMWRPVQWFRFDNLTTYDPNTGKLFAVSDSIKLRGRGDFAADLITRYDPTVGRFSQVNTQINLPLRGGWRVDSLLRYNGYTGKFDSTNWQIIHDWDCLEASLTFTDNPNGFAPDREFIFSIRLRALPGQRPFAKGPAGEATGIGLGDLY